VTINPAEAPEKAEGGDDDDVDLFGSDEEEDEEAARVREERLAEYKKKKEAKPKTIAKSVVTLDVKPWGKNFHVRCCEKFANKFQMTRPT
jgi:elongation factor 1-beta